ncbi:glycosyltransferase (plasmid) [Paroceanicella profunda]|uniref:Glycosyltransferase n=1 Tax=Paroceanicella profunda TaxID=2579971 RepID=A0A5B8FJA7_9RHOB|nr:glycosyltransferase [Paroceanicella profunda]QDL94701.1 glycosyltransferase [Paroceanicella profunda]
MTSTFTNKLEKGLWPNAYFELRISEGDRPFHITFRRADNTYSLNSMEEWNWGDEEVFPLSVPMEELAGFEVTVKDQIASVTILDKVHAFQMTVSEEDVELKPDASHVTWEASRASKVETFEVEVSPERASEVNIALKMIRLPEDLSEKTSRDLMNAARNDPGNYARFMASRPIAQAGKSLTIIDIEPNTLIFALAAKSLLPEVRLLKYAPDEDLVASLESIVEANGISNVEIATREEIADILRTGQGAVLVQGGLAFEAFGDVFDTLSPERRASLSFWTASMEIIPGNRIFPCANAQIWAPPNWTLNHNAATDVSGRRHGVDVAVAAYNAGEYLIECAESLLCEGRDDVRVIIVDDGSSDRSGEAAAAHFRDDPRVRVERKPNGGCASARNYGRLVSDATHIAFVDADDFVTPGFFGDLYDLALYSGCELTQGGFDFYDESLKKPYYPSYEEEFFRDYPRENFKGKQLLRVQSSDIIKGQPSIWRKVYRRDFLDAKKIYFPENVRAYDDYIFQMFTLTAARDVLMLPEHKYHYRQHAAQDIKQGDERHFYMLFMFQMLIQRSIAERWPNFRPYVESIVDSISWSANVLRVDLIESFLRANARFCVGVAKTYGPDVIEDLLPRIQHPDFAYYYQEETRKVAHISPGAFWAYFNGEIYHPDIIRMRQLMRKSS